MWTLGAGAAAAAIAEPARMDPAAPSAMMAGIMIARPTRMIPPWRLPRSEAWLVVLPTFTTYLLPVSVFRNPGKAIYPAGSYYLTFLNNGICIKTVIASLQEIFMAPC